MSFIVRSNAGKDAQSQTLTDRVEALRAALFWRSMGCRHVRIIEDGRVYNFKEFAGMIMIGETQVVSQ